MMESEVQVTTIQPSPPKTPHHKVHCGCGRMHVRKASIIIGLLTIMGGILNSVNTVFNTALPRSIRYGMGIYNAVLIIFGCLLIAGVKKRKHHLLTPFIVMMYILIVTSFILLILSIVGQFFIKWVVETVDDPQIPHYLQSSETSARIGLAVMSLAFLILLFIPIWYLDIVKKCYLHLQHATHLEKTNNAEMQQKY
ncbi:hypothetical protein L596_022192 [Steinernema carpocapsae]|uniref:Uncharacterized protein n=1 Tax=Steinernema carpocapsae TaxID=34508 RepID=A0A4U5MLE1_STECR|nr:hypothetical protein L596_022192 [Steinernema carpocapsae]